MLCTAVCRRLPRRKFPEWRLRCWRSLFKARVSSFPAACISLWIAFHLAASAAVMMLTAPTFRTCAGRSSDTVNIVFGTLRQIIVDNMLNMRNVQSSRGNVGCYQNTVFLFPKIRNDFLPQALFQIAVNGAGRQRKFVQFSGETFCAEFCFDENQNRTAACGKLGCQLIIFLRSICFDDFLFDFPERRFGLNQ